MNIRVLALLAAFVAAAVCLPAAVAIAAVGDSGTGISAVADTPAVAGVNYRIVEEDVLRMDVWGEPQLSNMQMQVTPDGRINAPYLGDLEVVGKTQVEVADEISKKLADLDIVIDAKVQISLITMHRAQVWVLGAVARPGSFEFKDGDTLLHAIAQGGSYTDDAMLESATLTRKGADAAVPVDLRKLLNGDFSQNQVLQNGDALFIPHEDYNNKIYVLGQVNRPGQYSLKDKTTLLAAISLAGGQTQRASITKTVVVRGDPAKPERVTTDLGRLFGKGDMTQDVALKPGDIVVVPETKKVEWSTIASIISAAVNVTYLRRLGW